MDTNLDSRFQHIVFEMSSFWNNQGWGPVQSGRANGTTTEPRRGSHIIVKHVRSVWLIVNQILLNTSKHSCCGRVLSMLFYHVWFICLASSHTNQRLAKSPNIGLAESLMSLQQSTIAISHWKIHPILNTGYLTWSLAMVQGVWPFLFVAKRRMFWLTPALKGKNMSNVTDRHSKYEKNMGRFAWIDPWTSPIHWWPQRHLIFHWRRSPQCPRIRSPIEKPSKHVWFHQENMWTFDINIIESTSPAGSTHLRCLAPDSLGYSRKR